MIDSTAVIITIEFLVLIVVLAGMLFWFDKKQTECLDRMDKRIDGLQDEMRSGLTSVLSEMREGIAEVRSETRALDAKVDSLGSKVDRIQGSLDVLVFGDRGVPPPVARERAEAERRVEETIGD